MMTDQEISPALPGERGFIAGAGRPTVLCELLGLDRQDRRLGQPAPAHETVGYFASWRSAFR
jgi:hypothetical protein